MKNNSINFVVLFEFLIITIKVKFICIMLIPLVTEIIIISKRSILLMYDNLYNICISSSKLIMIIIILYFDEKINNFIDQNIEST
jgi:hypothetical protein